jgi:hypothetical protein
MALGQIFSLVIRVLPVNFIPPFFYKEKHKQNTSSSSQACTVGLQAAVSP